MIPPITLLSARPSRGLAHGCSISPWPGPFQTSGVLALPKGQKSMNETSNAAAASAMSFGRRWARTIEGMGGGVIWVQIVAPTRAGKQGVFFSGWRQSARKVPDSLMGPLHRAPLEFQGPWQEITRAVNESPGLFRSGS